MREQQNSLERENMLRNFICADVPEEVLVTSLKSRVMFRILDNALVS